MKFAFLAGALALGFVPAAANATLQLQISDGTTTKTLTDVVNNGELTFYGSIDSFAVVVSTGIDEQRFGASSTPGIDLNSIEVSGKAGGTLTFSLTETGIKGSGPVTFNSQIGGTQSGSTLSYATYVDSSNTAFGTGTSVGHKAFTTTPYAGSFGATINPGNLYSMTEVATLTAKGPSVASFDAELRVPEPMSMTILGVGLVALGTVRRRRQPGITGQNGSI